MSRLAWWLPALALVGGGCFVDRSGTAPADAGLDEDAAPQVECRIDADCDDGQHCNGIELCAGGACQPGTPRSCDDAIACTAEVCDEVADACVRLPDHAACAAGEQCSTTLGCIPVEPCETAADCDDGFACNGAEQCDGDRCAPGTPPACDDGVACTVDACSEARGGCVNVPDDGACSGEDVCDPTDDCVPPTFCTGDADCDDGNFCDGAETCVGGRCQAGTPPDCGDSVACTVDLCDEATDVCVNVADDSLCAVDHGCTATGCVFEGECTGDADCDDGFFCNGDETCVGASCVPGTPPSCGDSIACTVDLCDEVAETCANVPDASACAVDHTCDPTIGCAPSCTSAADCDDGLFCNGSETCASGGCAPGAPPDCTDGIACTTDLCDETGDACRHLPDASACAIGSVCDEALGCIPECTNAADCDDGRFCNGAETCASGVCAAGSPPSCDDFVFCTVDVCDDAAAACRHFPNDGRCGASETCSAVSGCVPECVSNFDCDDGLFCNGAELCVSGACVGGTPRACGDAVACTVDVCDEVGDTCLNLPDDGRCTAPETCDAALGCVPECTGDPDCDDGLYCNGTETCSGGACVAGTPPDCDDSVSCTVDLCDETGDRCLHFEDDDMCGGVSVCTSSGCVP